MLYSQEPFHNVKSDTFSSDLNTSSDWNFFATSHGKGAVNGVGGTLKRTVWQMVKSQHVIINLPYEFFQYAKQNVKGVTILFTSAVIVNQSGLSNYKLI